MLLVEVLDAWVLSDLAETFRLGARVNGFALDVAVEGDRPNGLFFLGESDASCRTVETRCGGLGSGVPGLEGLW